MPLDISAFGKNDIRGIFGENVTADVFLYAGKAYVKYIEEKTGKEAKDLWFSVTYDARLHSVELKKALIKGVTSVGANVLELGLGPTPLGYFSEVKKFEVDGNQIEITGALIITASHNPKEYNGLKMTFHRHSFDADDIQNVAKIAQELYESNKKSYYLTGKTVQYDAASDYIENQLNNFPQNVGENLKIVVDSANATGGIIAPELYRSLGCEVIELYSEPDGNFPNHHPNPADEKTLDDIKAKIVETGADFGIAFDGDSDRVGIIDNTGYSLPGDYLLLIFALDVIKDFSLRGEKAKVVSEVKCSQILYDTINKNGGEAIMWKTGHGYIKSKMKEEKAVLAGEMSGHLFFKDRYYGFDDAIYAGCRFIEIVAKEKAKNKNFKVSDMIAALPHAYTSRELRYPCKNELKKVILQELSEIINKTPDMFGDEIKSIITIDGLRIIFDGGFAMIRQSNTEPVFTARFEAKDEETATKYQKSMVKVLDKLTKKYDKTEATV